MLFLIFNPYIFPYSFAFGTESQGIVIEIYPNEEQEQVSHK